MKCKSAGAWVSRQMSRIYFDGTSCCIVTFVEIEMKSETENKQTSKKKNSDCIIAKIITALLLKWPKKNPKHLSHHSDNCVFIFFTNGIENNWLQNFALTTRIIVRTMAVSYKSWIDRKNCGLLNLSAKTSRNSRKPRKENASTEIHWNYNDSYAMSCEREKQHSNM